MEFYDDYNDDLDTKDLISKNRNGSNEESNVSTNEIRGIKFTMCILFTLLLIALAFATWSWSVVWFNTQSFVTSVVPFESSKRDILEGDGILTDRSGSKIKIKNTGTYDV